MAERTEGTERTERAAPADERVDYLVVGAGVTGLGFANAIRDVAAARGAPPPVVRVVEAEAEAGGYCRTVVDAGFVWDYSGHFFHFKHPEIEAWLRARMPGEDLRTVAKQTSIRFAGRDIDFPFQKNIHQLPPEDFAECMRDLRAAAATAATEGPTAAPPASFLAMLQRKLGRGIVEKFLRPYNEKLYATDLDTLDVDAMGRFFPHATPEEIIAHTQDPKPDASYNATFTYPAGGAIRYIHALLADLPPETVALGERVTAIDVGARVATTSKRAIAYRHLVSSAPLPALLAMTRTPHDPAVFGWNKVLIFNLGFDRKGPAGVHWMYFPDRARRFYRVGWYDNIMGTDRMSLYVEIGARTGEVLDVEAERARVLADLAAEGIVTDHRLVAWHTVTLDPAYVHVTRASLAAAGELRARLAAAGVHSAGRYGRWTYCSIEDNLVEARELAAKLT
jgi:protoporphyrinogen oxidase